MARLRPDINAGSMADIAFLLLFFFLVTTTMNIDSGIVRMLPPAIDPEQVPPQVKKRNILTVLINRSDVLMIDDEIATISQLSGRVKEFISNPAHRPSLPEKAVKNIEFLGTVEVSKGIVYLKTDKATTYNMYIRVQDALTTAFGELRNGLSLRTFGVPYDKLTDPGKIQAIQEAIPVSISEAEPVDTGGTP